MKNQYQNWTGNSKFYFLYSPGSWISLSMDILAKKRRMFICFQLVAQRSLPANRSLFAFDYPILANRKRNSNQQRL